MDVYAIVNPVSGRREIASRLDKLSVRLADRGFRLHVLRTQSAHDATRLAASVSPDARAVIAVGGDGTCREVAEGLIGRDVPMCIWPTGTENILAKYYGYRRSVDRLVDVIVSGRRITCDIGTINDRRFMIIVGVGFDGYAAATLANRRKGHISYADWVACTIRALRRYSHPPVEVELDGQVVFKGPALVFVGVMRRYAMGLRILKRAEHDDGRLHVCVMPCHSNWQLYHHALRVFARWHPSGGVIYRTCQSARITSASAASVPVQMDGDAAGELPVECGILPGALQLLVLDRSLPAGKNA